jgi:glycosyltransferase involved in cell wall biosynthesis
MAGGADLIARSIEEGLRARGHNVWFAHAGNHSRSKWDIQLGRLLHYKPRNPYAPQLRDVELIKQDFESGYELNDFLAIWDVVSRMPTPPDVINFHNLHGNYFDLRFLSWASERFPLVLTLHDAWLLSGNCAHSFECGKWQSGCGNCPDISIYPGLRADGTKTNLARKREIYSHSSYRVITPSRWLAQRVARSVLALGARGVRVIHNGVDTSIFRPRDKFESRQKFGIASDEFVILFAANRFKANVFKDYGSFVAVINELRRTASLDSKFHFIGLGDSGQSGLVSSNVRFSSVPYVEDRQTVARLFSACDVYLHLAKADTFPSTVLEALASGLPVVANDVGGVPEQVKSITTLDTDLEQDREIIGGANGFIAPCASPAILVKALLKLKNGREFYKVMSQNARESGLRDFSLDRMISAYQVMFEHEIELFNHKKGL